MPGAAGTRFALVGAGRTVSISFQQTLRRQVSCAGIGLHSGTKVGLTLKPAPVGSGIVFRRADLGVDIPARVENVSGLHYATVLGKDGATVETVEHLLAALVSAGVDNVIIELTQREVPIMDGSSAPFLFLIHEAGTKRQSAPRSYLKVLRPMSVASGDKHIAIYPSDHFKVSYTISFDHPMLRHQSRTTRITEQSFSDDIASARTFGFLKEVEWMRQQGLALGGSLDNAIVIGDTGPLNALRFDDECVRHKILDAVGDLALIGRPVLGHVVAHRAGHALHTKLAAQLLAEPDAYAVVENVAVPAVETDGIPVQARAR
jgi:UDP-3-O-[3-hydroxymyristoyl] N-acetylglucosamine deacetylase